MRLRELHLKAFGAFTDRTLDLAGGREGLHIIHGPNEAGKSTALRAITQLLYGIPARTTDDFLHPMASLRAGATLANEQGALTFYRRKGNKNTLLAADERETLPDNTLAPFLGGVDQPAFENFFGLTHAQLVEGGEGLVQGQGDVGQALFSAAAGLGHLRELLKRLEDEADALFSPRASKPRINSALGTIKDLRDGVKKALLSSADWQALDADLREAEARRAALDAELAVARAEAARLQRIREALPLVAARAGLLEQRAPVAGAVLLPADFAERRQRCQTEAARAQAGHEAARKALESIEKELGGLAVDAVLLAHEDAIEELNERRAQNQKALADADRELAPALHRLETEAGRALQRLRPHWTLDQVEELRLAPGQAQRINELSRQGEALKTRRATAEDTLQQLRRDRERSAAALSGAAPVPDTAPVERALKQAMQLGGAERDLEKHRHTGAALAQSVEAGIARLGLWSGDRAALEALPVPPAATIERFRVDLGDAKKIHAAREDAVADLEAELRQAESDLDAYQKAHAAPSLEALEHARRERQTGWKIAREAWEAGIPPDAVVDPEALAWRDRIRAGYPEAANVADAYAALVEAADIAADRLRNEADRVAARAQLESSLDALRGRLAAARAAEADCASAVAAMEIAWTQTWAPAGIAPRTPAEMAAWKQAHAELLAQIQTLRDAESTAGALASAVDACRAAIGDALEQAGAPAPPAGESLSGAMARAEDWVEAQRRAREERERCARQVETLDRETIPAAEDALASAEGRLVAWQAEWGAIAEAIGAAATASPGEVLALVEAINALLAQATEADQLRGRIARIRRDDESFRAGVRQVLAAVAPDRRGGDEAAAVQALYAALTEGRAARQARDRLLRQRDAEAGRHRQAALIRAQVEAELHALCTEAGVSESAKLPEAEKASEARRRLEEELRGVEARLVALSAGAGLEALLAMAAGEDADAIEARLPAVETRVEDLDGERLALQEKIGDRKAKLGQMDGGDAAAVLEEEVQSAIAGLEDDVDTYARLKLAAHVLRTAIERYRAANQEPLLARAGEIFRILTLGSFGSLRADVNEKDEHILCGVRAGTGALVTVGGMSAGTADQLYLALRLASLERHLDTHPPMPFILDDILVNFDDARAAAALAVLAEVSARTQVIYFTHHQHLVALAKRQVDGNRLFVQDLTGK